MSSTVVEVDLNYLADWCIGLLQTIDSVNRTGVQARDVWYGDQVKIPRMPAICVEPGGLQRNPQGGSMMRQFLTNTDLIIMCYMGEVRDGTINQRDATTLGTVVSTILHEHSQTSEDPSYPGQGYSIHSFVQRMEPGYATRGGTLLRVARLTFTMLKQERLPAAAF